MLLVAASSDNFYRILKSIGYVNIFLYFIIFIHEIELYLASRERMSRLARESCAPDSGLLQQTNSCPNPFRAHPRGAFILHSFI